MALSEAVLTQLRDRLQRQGVVPPLPDGWRSQSATITANGPSYAGDFLVADLREGRWLEMALVDVCGKGTSVGPQALQFAGALGGLIGALPPAELMAAANHFLLRQESDESLATAVHIKVDLVTGDYTITSAGHPPALHWHLGERGWTVDNARGMALGVIAEADFTPSRGRLRPGEALMFYTDGVIETADRDLDDGIDWLREVALQAVDARGFTGMPRRILKKVPRGDDDRAMLVLERQPLTSPERDSERTAASALRPLSPSGAARVEVADDVLDVGLLDRQVGHVVRRRDRGDDRRGARVGGERQPLARALDPAHLGTGHVDGRGLVDQVDDERAGRAALGVQPGQRAVVDRGAVVDHDHPVAERLDVLQVVGGEHAAWCRARR